MSMRFQPNRLQRELEKPECREHFRKYFPSALEFYERYLLKSGVNCPLTQAALKALWAMESDRDAEGFEKALESGRWLST